MLHKIHTMAGVDTPSQPAGTVTVEKGQGDTMLSLLVEYGGEVVRVYLDWRMAARLMAAVGAAAGDM